jgi:predicted RNase H-like HicB family nuclease
MTSRAQLYAALPYAVEVTPDVTTDGAPCYVARYPELPGCVSHGATPEEALSNLEESREFFIAAMLEDGYEPPVPLSVTLGTNVPRAAVWILVDPVRVSDVPVTTGAPLPSIAPLAAIR